MTYDFNNIIKEDIYKNLKEKLKDIDFNEVIREFGSKQVEELFYIYKLKPDKNTAQAMVDAIMIGVMMGATLNHFKPEFSDENIKIALLKMFGGN